MRKAAVNILVFVIIGLVVLVVIASGIVPQVPKFFRENILPIFGVIPKPANESVRVVEAEDAEKKISSLVIDKNPELAARQLALSAFECWNHVRATEEDKYICWHVDSSKLKDGVSKDDILYFLKSLTPKSQSKLASKALNDNDNWLIEESIFAFSPRFYICADYDSLSNNDLVFSHNIYLCNPKAKAEDYIPYVLPSDKKDASDLIVRALANCWSSVKKTDFVGPCAFFDPKKLKGSITKKSIIGSFKKFDYIADIDDAIDVLDDWWEPDDDAFMELTITKNSKPFFVCASRDWGQSDDLCLTHSVRSDCCTTNHPLRERGVGT